MAGGDSSTGVLSSAELYDPATGTWSSTGSLAGPRSNLKYATLLPNGKVLVAGGHSGSAYLSSAELYDPVTGTWSSTGSLATARYFHTATLLPNGHVLAAAGIGTGNTFLASAELFSTAICAAAANQPPTADAGPDQTVECTGPSGANVTLNGTGSSDPDNDTLTYTWTDAFNNVIATGPTPTVTLPVGSHTLMLTVDDGKGGTASDTVQVTVQDTTAPSIGTISATPNVLWPPNHRMVPVSVAAAVSDACDAGASCQVLSVTSNEPVNGLGDGDTAPDWQITGLLTVNLRAERSGRGNGRTYTITVQCTDASGNSATKTVTVTVPKSQGK